MGVGQARIGLDFREGFRENPRGIGLYCRHLLREFTALAPPYDVLLFHERPTPPHLPPLPPVARPEQIEMRGGRWHLWERLALPMRLVSEGVDLYHGTYNTLPPRRPLLGRRRLVVTLHDVLVTWLDEDLDDAFVRYARRITRRVVRQADAILTVSRFSRDDIVERFGADPAKVRIVPNGIHPLFHADAPAADVERARREHAGGRPYLFAIGSALRRKNTDVLFPLLRRLADLGHDEVLVVSGLEGRALEDRRRVARQVGVEDRVAFVGYLDWAELRALMTGAELCVYPSLAEGWGIPVVEALACGTPVATSDRTAMPEAGGDLARYFDPEKLDSIVAACDEALRGRDRFARDAARAHARAYSWRRCAEDTLAVYSELLA
ncbi:MAG: glycosyltransferase family 1 protein [Planctomycetota bacterium]